MTTFVGADGQLRTVSTVNPLPVTGGGGGGGGGGDASAANQVLQLTELKSIAGLQIPPHDHLTLTYTGSDLTQVVYRTGGSGGTTVATVNLGYTSGVLTTVARV